MKIFFKVFILSLALIGLVFQLLWGTFDLLLSLLSVAFMSLVFASVLRLMFQKFRVKRFSYFFLHINIFIWSLIGFLISCIGGFAYYHNHIHPAILANVTLENSSGQKVIFVKMSHIATENFYQKKKQSIEKGAQEGFIILAEGVKTGSEESTEKFNKMLGFEFQEDIYEKISKAFHYTHQTPDIYENIPKEKLVSVDISLDDVVALIDGDNTITSKNTEVLSIDEALINFVHLSDFQKMILRYLGSSVLNAVAKLNGDKFSMDAMDIRILDVILNKRNEPIIEYIITHPNQNFAIVYGALHYEGVLEGLKKSDNSWRIIGVEPFVPYSQE